MAWRSEAVWPLVGRDEELALLTDVLTREQRSAVIAARAGVGKTRLARAAMERASGTGYASELVVATRSAQTVAFGAFADLVPGSGVAASERVHLFRAVRDELQQRSAGAPSVLVVDDAHLLDGGSAALVHFLALSAAVRVLVTVRTGEPVPDAVTALWRDDLATRLELQPLGPVDVERLLAAALGGPVEPRTARRMWTESGGNPLYVREVAIEAVRAGTLRDDGGVWCWRGELTIGGRLRELVAARLEGLTAGERATLELLALGEPLPEPVLARIGTGDAVEALERRGLVAAAEGPTGPELRLDHPLFAEAVRDALTASERAAHCRTLSAALDPHGVGDRSLLRVARWQLDGGGPRDPDLLTRASVRAHRLFDAALAERFARAALAERDDTPARLALGQALMRRGRFAAAVEVVEPLIGAGLVHEDVDDDERAELAMLLADANFWGCGRVAETLAALEQLEASAHGPAARARIRAERSALLVAEGRFEDAAALADPLVTDPDADPQARVRAVTAAGTAASFGGHPARALAHCTTLLPVALAEVDTRPSGLGWVLAQQLLGLTCLGRFDDAEQLLLPIRAMAIAEGDDEIVGSSSLVLARLSLSRGRLHDATAMAREAVSVLLRYDPSRYLPWALAILAQARAQAGDVDGARAAMGDVDHLSTGALEVYGFELTAGRAWSVAASGALTEAGRLLVAGAEHCASSGNRFGEGILLHEALRCGLEPLVVRAALAPVVKASEMEVFEVFLAHAEALANDRGVALEAVCDRFEAMNAMLFAAEAAAEAARAFRREGLASNATRAEGRSARLSAVCGPAATPILTARRYTAALTRREYEVSRLAGAGLSNAEIAEQLGIGVRTVEGHLLRAGTKLGVHRRTDFATALDDSPA